MFVYLLLAGGMLYGVAPSAPQGFAAVTLGVADLVVLAVLVLHSAAHGGIVWRFGS